MVLHYADVVDVDEINAVTDYNDVAGISELMTNVGWKQLTYKEARPGDIGIGDGHAFFMCTKDTIWDEAIGQYYVFNQVSRVRAEGPYRWGEMKNAVYFRCP